MTDLVERVIRGWEESKMWDETTQAEIAIAIVVEKAAKVVDDYASVISDWEKYQPNNSNTHGLTMADVAAAIRALAEDKT